MRVRAVLITAVLIAAALLPAPPGVTAAPVSPAQEPWARDGWFTTSDGIRLHYLEAGHGHSIVMVPGWTMPAWIFQAQIADFARSWHVVALDPRSQGESEIAASGHEPFRRGRDVAELLAHLGDSDAVLLGWSLGVMDVLSCVHQFGDRNIAALVLVDNSVGEEPAPSSGPSAPGRRLPRVVSREVRMHRFVVSMFRVTPSPEYVDRLTEAALRTPPEAAAALLSYDVPRSFWRDAVYSTAKPVLYIVTPRFAGQAANLAARHPNTESVVLRNVGHAMFVDDPARFDNLVQGFIRQRLWP